MSGVTERTQGVGVGPAILTFTAFGAVQGLALRSIGYLADDVEQPMGLIALALFTAAAPLAFWLTAARESRIWSAAFAVGLGGLIAGLYLLAELVFGWGYQDSPAPFLAVGAAVIMGGISIPFFRTVFERGQSPTHYPSLFEFAWNTPVVVGVSLAFLLAFWLVLVLWGALFRLIGVDFFQDLFQDDWFLPIAFGAAFASAVFVVREREGVVLAVRGVLFALLHILAPVLAFASLLFVVFLPFTGLDALWDTPSATATMLFATAFGVVFVNAALGDGEDAAGEGLWRSVVAWSAKVQALVLPVFAGLAAYAVYLRVAQYGLAVDRILAMLFVLVASAHALVYGAFVLLPAGADLIRRANVYLAGGLLLLAVAIQTPVLNLHGLSANDQANRLAAGKVEAGDFDYGYLKFELGKAGERALARLRERTDIPNAEQVAAEIDALERYDAYYAWRRDRRAGVPIADTASASDFSVWPKGASVSTDLLAFLNSERRWASDCNDGEAPRCTLVFADLFGDPVEEAVLIVEGRDRAVIAQMFVLEDGEWRYLTNAWENFNRGGASLADFKRALDSGDIEPIDPPFRYLRIGDTTLELTPRDYDIESVFDATADAIPPAEEDQPDE